MAGTMIRCSGEREGERCYRYARFVRAKGSHSDFSYTCEGCSTGQKPYVPRSSQRKGQQKQAKTKKK